MEAAAIIKLLLGGYAVLGTVIGVYFRLDQRKTDARMREYQERIKGYQALLDKRETEMQLMDQRITQLYEKFLDRMRDDS